jgi:hypothetical protein
MSALALGLFALANQLSAQNRIQGEDLQVTTNASAICQGVRPSDNAQLNFRALQLDNTGTQSQFVTCAFSTVRDQAVADSRIVNYFGAFFANRNSTERTVSCTGVQGFANDPNNVYESQSVTVLPNNSPGTPTTGYIFFGPASDTDPLYYQNVSMTCLLPGGVSIADTYVGFKLDDAVQP